MDALLYAPQRSRNVGALFDEDFDMPESAPDPEVIEAVFSASEMAGARELAWLAGHAAGVQEVAASGEAATRQALEAIAAQFNAASDAAAAHAEKSAEAIAGLLLSSLAATFPALCACYGDAEMRAIVRAVLPALTQEPAITIRANPRTATAVAKEIERLNPELAAHVQTTASDAMPPGDVRIAWRNGAIARDATALWRQVAAVLTPAALLPTAPLPTERAIQETVDG
jgi:flagellar biosynthesis/type III secretory pathway protein FliH